MDMEKVIKGLYDIGGFVAERIGIEQARNFIRTIDDACAMLKEQETANLYKCPNCGTWVSAENVVRCKDCKNHGTMDCPMCEEGNCIFHTADNWYCADGERK